MAWDARAATAVEGIGSNLESTHIPRPLLIFLEWSDRTEVALRFNKFCERNVDESVFGVDDSSNEEADGGEQSLKSHEVFQRYERFFEGEVAAFLEKASITEDDFSRACKSVLQCERRQHDEEKKSCRVLNERKNAEEDDVRYSRNSAEKQEEEKEGSWARGGNNVRLGDTDASMLLQMALSSLSYVSFCHLIRRWRREVRQGNAAASDLGIL